MKPMALMIPVENWQEGFLWYQQAFPQAEVVELPEFAFRALRIGDFTIEIVNGDDKLPSANAGTVLYWQVDNLSEAIVRFRQLGAGLYRGPMAIEDGLGMSQVKDPFGNLIGLRGPWVSA